VPASGVSELPGVRTDASVPIRSLWRALIRFESGKIATEVAVRNTIGFTLAVSLGTLLASPSTGALAGLGALNVSYSDGRDPYSLRARRMLLSALLCAITVFLGAISAHNDIAAIAVAALWAFFAGMVVALGTTAGDLGAITLVTLVVFAAKPLPPLQALGAASVAFGGGLLQTLLSILLLPIRRYGPERRIIADIFGELARMAKSPPSAVNAPPMTKQISDAQEAFAPLARDHGVEAERHVFLLLQAERIRLSVFNLGRLRRRIARDPGGESAAAALSRILDDASDALQLVGPTVLAPANPDLAAASTHGPSNRLTADLLRLRALAMPPDHAFFAALLRDARHQSDALRSQIVAAAAAASGTRNDPYPADSQSPVAEASAEPWRLRFQGWRARLAANLSLESTVFRHAVRLAICLAVGDALGRSLSLQRTYWIPMTIAIVLKPDFTSTFSRGVLRVGGTLAGLVLATALFHFFHIGPGTDIALMAVFTLLLRWVGPANYGIFVIAVSALVVLLIAVTGVAPGDVIAARAMNTAIGGGLALAAYAIWPTWEKTQTRSALADMLDAYRAYTSAVTGAYGGQPLSAIEEVRVRARRARSNAVASVDRMSGEPGVTTRQLTSLNAILVHSHSFVYAAMAMEARLYRLRRDAQPTWMPGFAASVEHALSAMAGALRDPARLGAGTNRRRGLGDVEVPAPALAPGGNTLLEIEADRVRTSLRSLGEEIARRGWL
jgi:uncharacterized membrane protein YccC